MSRKTWLFLPLLGLGAWLFGGYGTNECTIELGLTDEQSSVSADLWDLDGQSISFYRLEGGTPRGPWVVKTKASKAKIEVHWNEGGERKELLRDLEIQDNATVVVHLHE